MAYTCIPTAPGKQQEGSGLQSDYPEKTIIVIFTFHCLGMWLKALSLGNGPPVRPHHHIPGLPHCLRSQWLQASHLPARAAPAEVTGSIWLCLQKTGFSSHHTVGCTSRTCRRKTLSLPIAALLSTNTVGRLVRATGLGSLSQVGCLPRAPTLRGCRKPCVSIPSEKQSNDCGHRYR